MKKRLLINIVGTIFFTLILVTVLFVSIVNYQYEENVKSDLKINNGYVEKIISSKEVNDFGKLLNNVYINSDIELIVLNNQNQIIFSNIQDRSKLDVSKMYEIDKAKTYGESYTIRFNNTDNKNVIYYATNKKNSYTVISSEVLSLSGVIAIKYIEYYIFMVIIAMVLSIYFGLRMSNSIILPIKNLEFTTSLVAKGELKRRVLIESDDELGHLSKTFNKMAEQLQLTMQDALEKQMKMEAILKSMESGVIAVDRNNKVIMINPYAEVLFGIEKDIIGKNFIESIRDFEFEEVFKSKSNEYKELKILWPKERILRIKTADIISDKKHIGTVAVVQDITDIKKLENMRSQFVANVSHELKTPLTSIKGFAETLKYVKDEEKRIQFLDIIDEEVERLTRLINDILTLSDIEVHKTMKKENFYVDEVLNNIFNLMKNTADSKSIKLEIVENSHTKLIGEKDMFKQMVLNLVDNAIKYSEVNDKVSFGAKTEKNLCVIWIKDTGMGISKEHIARLFERFYRVDKARSRAKGGTGLGLAIVKHIVMNFSGTINVESEIGKGSKFIIKIPLEKMD
ncbi:two-component system, OmpR family, phosphate regulon sensor histidine kinase PhoR [Clostridium acidisoli DSM 12555]|jgi:two-component system phosphate regulon sensor histidine kinase PhoR|uniref:histidine kinase n=1 Tax=Clostridium acidisoli DSM 12555 TaxID=1121291 RepID=A0A1W1XCM8_9CLOT|nr:sensor histidine kinase [Clostridium acidisoli]SMC21554.1 two-component system, OmpR family, phosphate regulon sensor histidine kinase PhoR [Clostridium acidisoli DSM 12555]